MIGNGPVVDVTHAYVGRAPCGHVIVIICDDGAKNVAKHVGDFIRRGGIIERVTIDEARKAELCPCDRNARWERP